VLTLWLTSLQRWRKSLRTLRVRICVVVSESFSSPPRQPNRSEGQRLLLANSELQTNKLRLLSFVLKRGSWFTIVTVLNVGTLRIRHNSATCSSQFTIQARYPFQPSPGNLVATVYNHIHYRAYDL